MSNIPCGLERLYALKHIDIHSNQITDLSELSRLATLASLTHLWSSSNPLVTLHPDWRIKVFNYLIDEQRDIDLHDHHLGINLRIDSFKPSFSERKSIQQQPSLFLKPNGINHNKTVKKRRYTCVMGTEENGGQVRKPGTVTLRLI